MFLFLDLSSFGFIFDATIDFLKSDDRIYFKVEGFFSISSLCYVSVQFPLQLQSYMSSDN